MSTVLAQFQKHPLWPSVLQTLDTLKQHGFQAFVVGGAVRDACLSRSLKDFDVVTDALPDQVESLFPKTLSLGKAFGVIAVQTSGTVVEVATFRKDGEYDSLGRSPKAVEYSDIENDAQRRDFTINALYYDPEKDEIQDFYNGQRDLENCWVRAIGAPSLRFREDPLRLLRAVRFAVQLGFDIEENTLWAIEKNAEQMGRVSRERVLNELKLILSSDNWSRGIFILSESHLWSAIFGEPLNFSKDFFEKCSRLPVAGWLERFLWCALNSDALEFLKSLKISNSDMKSAEFLLKASKTLLDPKLRLAEGLELLNKAPLPEFLNYMQGLVVLTGLDLKNLDVLRARLLKIADPDGKLPAPILSGKDLLNLGLKPGKAFGEMMKEIYYLQIEGVLDSPEKILNYIKTIPRTSNEV